MVLWQLITDAAVDTGPPSEGAMMLECNGHFSSWAGVFFLGGVCPVLRLDLAHPVIISHLSK